MSTSLKVISGFFSVIFIVSVSFIIFFTTADSSSSESESSGSNLTENLRGPADSDLAKMERGEMEFTVSNFAGGNEISEMEFADDLHKMTHQKIFAEEKWGHKQITDESIEEMLRLAEESDYEYREFYIDALEQWQSGNFDNAVRVHNIIWNAKEGTVGEALRLMSPGEEQYYIKEHFE